MIMKYNSGMLSHIRAHKEKKQEKSNPISLVFRLINQYHSVDRLYASEKEKIELRSLIEDQINKNKNKLPQSIKSKVAAWLSNEKLWIADREFYLNLVN